MYKRFNYFYGNNSCNINTLMFSWPHPWHDITSLVTKNHCQPQERVREMCCLCTRTNLTTSVGHLWSHCNRFYYELICANGKLSYERNFETSSTTWRFQLVLDKLTVCNPIKEIRVPRNYNFDTFHFRLFNRQFLVEIQFLDFQLH